MFLCAWSRSAVWSSVLPKKKSESSNDSIKQYFRLYLKFLMLQLCIFTWLSVSCCDGLRSDLLRSKDHVVAQDSRYFISLSQHDWKFSDVFLKMFRCDATNRTGHVPKSRQKYLALFPQTQQIISPTSRRNIMFRRYRRDWRRLDVSQEISNDKWSDTELIKWNLLRTRITLVVW